MYYSISSPQNQQLKRWKKLQSKKGRKNSCTYLVEGIHLLQEAKKSQAKIEAIIVDEKFQDTEAILPSLSSDVPIYQLTSAIFSQLIETQQSQGIIAEVTMPIWDFEETLEQSSMILLLDGVQDPGNLGTILRTSAAAAVDMVILGEGTVDPFNSKVIRSTMGALFHLPVFEQDLLSVLPILKKEKITIVGTSPRNGVYTFDYTFPDKVGIILGNEARGIQPQLLEQLDQAVMVPMPGVAESYNVSVTSGMLLYELIRQRYQTENNYVSDMFC